MKRAAFLFSAVLMFAACPPQKVPDGGDDDAGVDGGDAGGEGGGSGGAQGGGTGGQGGGTEPIQVRINRLLPPRGPSAGGTNVLVEGAGFLNGVAATGSVAKTLTSILVGGNQAQDFQIIDDELLEFRTPPGTPGGATVHITNTNGGFLCNNCFTFYDELVVTSFTPASGPLAGGNELTINGSGFTVDTQVLLGSFAAPVVTFVSATELKAIAPRGQAPGEVDLVVYNKNGVSRQRRAYTYEGELRISGITPATGDAAGGALITLTGANFGEGATVSFGANAGTGVTVNSATQLVVTLPAGAPGAVDVTVTSQGQSWTAKKAFTYFDPAGAFAVLGVSPRLVREGDVVLLTGQRLDEAASLDVTIGGVAATVGVRTFSTAEVLVPLRGAAPRVSDVVVTGDSTVTLTQGATWKVGLTSVTPAAGPAAGGTPITLTGQALPPAVTVKVGALAGTGVSVQNETSATLTTPAGGGGVASAVYLVDNADAENEALLAGAFTFEEPLSLGRVQPERGAVAGGTLVTVLGSGFGESTRVRFGPYVARDFKLIDSHTLTCRTPKSNAGVVDVTLERVDETDVLPGGFTYFDPRSSSGGLSGGPMVGTLNVTVLTGGSTPLEDAFVIVGTQSSTPFQGLTDYRGQITFSDDTLVKADSVTVFKTCYQTATVTGVNAENLTIFLDAIGGPGCGEPGNGQQGTPAAAPVIKGKVVGLKAPRPLDAGEVLEARVYLANTSLFQGPPLGNPITHTEPLVWSRQDDGGYIRQTRAVTAAEVWRIREEGGEYCVFAGAGLRAAYAVVGIATDVQPPDAGEPDGGDDAGVDGGDDAGVDAGEVDAGPPPVPVVTCLGTIYDPDGGYPATAPFEPFAMGVKRAIPASIDSIAENQHIVIDTALDMTVPVTIDSPLTCGAAPCPVDAYAWLELGAEGYIPNVGNFDSLTGAGPTSISSTSPTFNHARFPRLDGSNFIFMMQSIHEGGPFYRESNFFRRQPGDLTAGINAGPMLRWPLITAPTSNFTGTVSWTMPPGAAPDIHEVWLYNPNTRQVLWSIVMPGNETTVSLPQVAVAKLNSEQAGQTLYVYITSSRSPRFAYNQWTYDLLTGLTWSSFTVSLGAFQP